MNCDSQGAIAIANNPEKHSRTKHIDLKYHFVRDYVEKKFINLKYCSTDEMLADLMTKALCQPTFKRLCEQIMDVGLKGSVGL